MSIPANIDVLIVGAGPTGLMLGNQLGRRGIGALIIDRHPAPPVQTRALRVPARTLEHYAHLEILQPAVAEGAVTGAMFARELNVLVYPDGFHLFFPMDGTNHWRIGGIVPRELRERDDLDFDAGGPGARKKVGSPLAVQACSWFSTYRI